MGVGVCVCTFACADAFVSTYCCNEKLAIVMKVTAKNIMFHLDNQGPSSTALAYSIMIRELNIRV